MQVKLRKIGMITLLIYFPSLFITVHIMLTVFACDSVYVGRGGYCIDVMVLILMAPCLSVIGLRGFPHFLSYIL
jgi:hypothetical protein